MDSGVEGDVIRIKIEARYTPVTPVTPPDPVTHTVTLPTGTGYTADFVAGSSSPAAAGSIVNFTVVATEGYKITSVTDGTNTLTADNGVYTINEIAADTTIVVVATLLGRIKMKKFLLVFIVALLCGASFAGAECLQSLGLP